MFSVEETAISTQMGLDKVKSTPAKNKATTKKKASKKRR